MFSAELVPLQVLVCEFSYHLQLPSNIQSKLHMEEIDECMYKKGRYDHITHLVKTVKYLESKKSNRYPMFSLIYSC